MGKVFYIYRTLRQFIFMARKKGDCEDCCSFSVVFTPENCLTIKRIQAQSLLKGRKLSFENAVNKLISEYRFAKETGAIIK
jgi:hypothetical protein